MDQDRVAASYRQRLAALYLELKESRDPELPFALAQLERDLYRRFGSEDAASCEILLH